MKQVEDKDGWNEVLDGTELGFVTVNKDCDYSFEETPTNDDEIHHTTARQIWGIKGKAMSIRDPNPKVTPPLRYAFATDPSPEE